MNEPLPTRPRPALRSLAALLLVLGLAGASACSSSSDSSDAKGDSIGVSDAGPDSDSGTGSGSGADADVPEWWGDLPVPDGVESVQVIAQPRSDGGGGQLMFIIDPSMTADGDEIVAKFSDQLRDAGYEVDDDGPAIEATKGDTELSYHSSADGTLSVARI